MTVLTSLCGASLQCIAGNQLLTSSTEFHMLRRGVHAITNKKSGIIFIYLNTASRGSNNWKSEPNTSKHQG